MEIYAIDDPRVAVYSKLTDNELRNRLDPEFGVVVVESPKVINMALRAHLHPISLLCEERHLTGDAKEILEQLGKDVPIYTGSREVLQKITGYKLTRGVLCAMKRPAPAIVSDILKDARRVCVLSGVCDTTNVGAIFRTAAALGMDAIVLADAACDPLNRRAVRVSMGTVFSIPWCSVNSLDELHNYGFKTVAFALRGTSIPIDSPVLKGESKLAMIFGTEGNGLSEESIDHADYVVTIPMHRQIDSLNVAAAAAIAIWELRL